MKKLIILLLIPLFLSGCYDYNELNDLAIISGIGIDYEDDSFLVTYEILSTKKEGDSSAPSKSYNVSAKGKTITEAFQNNGNNLSLTPNYDHIEVIVISEKVAKNHFEECLEYIIRNAKIRNELYFAIAEDVSAKEIVSASSSKHPIASDFINDLLENNNETTNASYYMPLTEVLNSILADGSDTLISAVTLNNKNIKLNGIGLFKGYKLKTILDNDKSSIINLLNNFHTKSITFKKTCQKDKNTVISVYSSNLKIEAKNNQIEISGRISGRINEDNCGYNLKDKDAYPKLEKEFTKVIERDILELITIIQNHETDVLKLGKSYYNNTRIKNYDLWQNMNVKFNIDLKINKKGLVFEVK